MPTSSFIEIPDFNGTSKKSGTLADVAEINYPLIRFDDNNVVQTLTGLTGSYDDGDFLGTGLTFPNMAADNGWGGSISSASLNVDDDTVAGDTFSLLLFSQSVISTDNAALSALSLTDAQADAYAGTIVFSSGVGISSRALFRASSINQRYTCDAAATSLFGLLVLNAASSRSLSSARASVSLQFTRS